MPDNELTVRLMTSARRHPRVVERVEWLHRHRAAVAALSLAGVLGTLMLDRMLHGYVMSGLYLVPLVLLTLTESERVVGAAAVACLVLATTVMIVQDTFDTQHLLVLGYSVFAGSGLVALTYLVNRLSTLSRFAIVRAQLAEASSDIVGMSRNRADLDELLQYVVERSGEQVDAAAGMLLRLDDGDWCGRAGFGLGVDAREIELPFAALPVAAEALEYDRALLVDDARRDHRVPPAEVTRFGLQRLIVAPMSAFGRDVGVLILSRPVEAGGFSGDQVMFTESVAQYAAAACENVRLMRELEERRRDLELVRDSSLDIAGSLDLTQVLDSVVRRLVDALDMDSCAIYRLQAEGSEFRLLASYGEGAFAAGTQVGAVYSMDIAASGFEAVRSRRPIVVHDASDARLSEFERRVFVERGHRTLLGLPLRTRDRIIGLVELFDDRRVRELPADQLQLARAICRFAALAIDNAQLYDDERETANHLDLLTRQLTELQEISLALNELVGGADPQGILDHVAGAGARLLGARCAVFVQRDGRGVRVSARWGDDDGIHLDAARLEKVLGRQVKSVSSSPLTVGRPAEEVDGLLVSPVNTGQIGRELALVFAGARGGAFGEEDRLLATTLATQVGATLRNALSFRREHEIAETFQNALRIEPWPIAGLSVGVHYDPAGEAARVGGDFYDLVQLAPGRLMVVVGDVCGKGLSAAAQTAVVRYMLRAYAAEGSPGEALSRLNATLVAQSATQPFVTMLVAYVDVDRHMIEYAVAGHPRPIVLAGSTDFIVPGDGDIPVGIFANIVYPTNRVVLPDDSVILLFTDGVVEARCEGRLLGEARLREIVRRHADLSAADLAAGIVTDVKGYAGGRLEDDVLAVVLRLP